MQIDFLPAKCGDAIIIKFIDHSEKKRLIVIDFGKSRNKELKGWISNLKDEIGTDGQIDLFIITHMDDDHIGGVVSLFKKDDKIIIPKVNEWWVNHSLEIEKETLNRKINAEQLIDVKENLTEIG